MKKNKIWQLYFTFFIFTTDDKFSARVLQHFDIMVKNLSEGFKTWKGVFQIFY